MVCCMVHVVLPEAVNIGVVIGEELFVDASTKQHSYSVVTGHLSFSNVLLFVTMEFQIVTGVVCV